MFRFEKLDVWHKAIEFADQIYSLSEKSFPTDEPAGLVGQMRRAAVAVSSNVAAGSSRTSDSDFARFIEASSGSLMEVVSHAFLAKRRGVLLDPDFQQLYQFAEDLSRMLSGLRATLLRRSPIAGREWRVESRETHVQSQQGGESRETRVESQKWQRVSNP